jgi:DNA gyrase subunit A
MSRGIIALNLDENDELLGAAISNGNQYVFLGTHEGKAIRFHESQVRPMGRPARGVRAMTLEGDDYIVGMEIVEEQSLVLSIAENGYGKRTSVSEYRLTARGGKGVINIKTSRRNGMVVDVLCVKDDTELMLITAEGKIIRIEAAKIRQAGRSTQGVRLVSLEEGDKVAAASVIPEPDANGGDKEGDGQSELPLQ